jgi:pilus assembly protein Flp/PilA
MTKLLNFFADKRGAAMIEYGLIAALVSVVLIAALTALGGDLDALFGNIGSAVDQAA